MEKAFGLIGTILNLMKIAETSQLKQGVEKKEYVLIQLKKIAPEVSEQGWELCLNLIDFIILVSKDRKILNVFRHKNCCLSC